MSKEIDGLNERALALFSLEKAASPEDIADGIICAVKDGEVLPTPVQVAMKRMEKVVKIFLADENVKEIVKDDAQEYIDGSKAKTAIVFGAKVAVGAVHTSYDFKKCGHTELDEWYDILKTAKMNIKALEDSLKDMAKEQEKNYTDAQTFGIPNKSFEVVVKLLPRLDYDPVGEIVEVTPPTKFQKMGVKVTL